MRCSKPSDHSMFLAGSGLMMVTASVLCRRLAAGGVKNGGCAKGQTPSPCTV